MNQKILIVFTLFLLITILLLLLMSDAKAKSARIRVLVIIPGNPVDAGILEIIKSFLEKMAADNNFTFTIADETNPPGSRPSDFYPVVLQMQPYSSSGEWGTINISPADPASIHITTGPDALLCHDPEFSLRVRDAILQAASTR